MKTITIATLFCSSLFGAVPWGELQHPSGLKVLLTKADPAQLPGNLVPVIPFSQPYVFLAIQASSEDVKSFAVKLVLKKGDIVYTVRQTAKRYVDEFGSRTPVMFFGFPDEVLELSVSEIRQEVTWTQ